MDKKCFNTEYETQWRKEYEYLKELGILYSYVKRDENNIATYKYKKTPELFKALEFFYAQK